MTRGAKKHARHNDRDARGSTSDLHVMALRAFIESATFVRVRHHGGRGLLTTVTHSGFPAAAARVSGAAEAEERGKETSNHPHEHPARLW